MADDPFEVLKQIGDLIAALFKFLATLPQRIAGVVFGVTNIFLGIARETGHIAKVAEIGVWDSVIVLFTLWEFIKTYAICSVYFLSNLRKCIFYYFIDICLVILYLPVRLILYILYLMGIDLYPTEESIWENIEMLDRTIYGSAGIHIMYWPKPIRDDCYNCKRLKIDYVMSTAGGVSDDLFRIIPDMLKAGIPYFKKGAQNLKQVLQMDPDPTFIDPPIYFE